MKSTDLTPLERARADLTKNAEAIRKLEHEAEVLRGVIKYLETDGDDAAAATDVEPPRSAHVRKAQKSTKETTASEFCARFVEDNGPAEGGALYEAFIASGQKLTGKNRNAQMATLAGYLNRVKALKYYRDYGRWWFADRPYPAKKSGFF